MKINLRKDLAPLREAAKAKIDNAAEAERLKYLTNGSAQAMVYRAKQDEAADFIANGTIGPFIASEAQALGMTHQQVVDRWVTMQSQWLMIAAQIEAVRLVSKDAVDAAGTPAAIDAAANVSWS